MLYIRKTLTTVKTNCDVGISCVVFKGVIVGGLRHIVAMAELIEVKH